MNRYRNETSAERNRREVLNRERRHRMDIEMLRGGYQINYDSIRNDNIIVNKEAVQLMEKTVLKQRQDIALLKDEIKKIRKFRKEYDASALIIKQQKTQLELLRLDKKKLYLENVKLSNFDKMDKGLLDKVSNENLQLRRNKSQLELSNSTLKNSLNYYKKGYYEYSRKEKENVNKDYNKGYNEAIDSLVTIATLEQILSLRSKLIDKKHKNESCDKHNPSLVNSFNRLLKFFNIK